MNFIMRLVDNRDPASLAAKFRRRRFEKFKDLIQKLPRPIKILDVGGTETFWKVVGVGEMEHVEITLLNLQLVPTSLPGFRAIVGDATDLSQFSDGYFDVVFSNSVIEHLGTYSNQSRMAKEVQRVGKCYWIQTPNYYFPIEPHFLFPGFHWLPLKARVWLVAHFDLGWYKRAENVEMAKEIVQSIRLLKKEELLKLFPGGKLYYERLFGLVKSFVVYDGF
ncbi:class I SAM-dependent methyltransferase [Chloroflexus sp.]|uniref:class I SAM-dependent methyltransferase n=1 Tax=Chloroflexus sp. TaxID=1904827 RepID=UPI003D0DCDDB